MSLNENQISEDWNFSKKIKNNQLQCLACPRFCKLDEGEIGWCGGRVRVKDKIISRTYGLVSSIANDPIEKKPLYHFKPGTSILSIGTIGCNLSCLHCQNSSISMTRSVSFLREYLPKDAINDSISQGISSIALTYNEPLINFEYIRDIGKLTLKNNIDLVLVTNGYCNDDLALKLTPYIKGANIDVKGFTSEFYKEVCGQASLKPVLNTCKRFFEHNIHLEITNLIIPTKNDSKEEISSMIEWIITNLSDQVPLHFSRFHPDWQLKNLPPTPISTLEMAYNTAKDMGLKYVYIGNVRNDNYNSTFCPSCNSRLIHRTGFSTKIENFDESSGLCKRCNNKIPIYT